MGKTVIIFSTITGNAFRLAEAAASVVPDHAGPYNIRYERCVLIDEKQTVFGKNALAGSNQLPPEFCIFRIVRIIGRQTALDREQILSADFSHIADILNQRIAIEVEAQIDEVGQSVEAL